MCLEVYTNLCIIYFYQFYISIIKISFFFFILLLLFVILYNFEVCLLNFVYFLGQLVLPRLFLINNITFFIIYLNYKYIPTYICYKFTYKKFFFFALYIGHDQSVCLSTSFLVYFSLSVVLF